MSKGHHAEPAGVCKGKQSQAKAQERGEHEKVKINIVLATEKNTTYV